MIGVTLSADLASNLIESPAHGLVANDPVTFSPYGPTLPGGLVVGTVYYVIAGGLTVDAFEVSATLGGSAVDVTSVGTFYVRQTTLGIVYPPGAVCVSDDVGTLWIAGTSLRTAGWGITDLSTLWGELPALRGKNVLLPLFAGTSAYPRRIDQNVVLLPMEITGVCDQNGNLYGNDEIGLETNLEYLLNNAFLPPAAPTATQDAVLQTPSGSMLGAAVQVSGFHRREDKERGLFRAVLELTLPDGRFT